MSDSQIKKEKNKNLQVKGTNNSWPTVDIARVMKATDEAKFHNSPHTLLVSLLSTCPDQ